GLLAGGGIGFALMLLMAAAPGSGGAVVGEPGRVLLFLSGLAGAGAMILPGVSGGYLLLLLGQYVVILSAIEGLKQAVVGGSAGAEAWLGPIGVLLPVGLGVALGIVGVSNLLRWLLHHAEKATLGALLGLLLGAVVGLWPFQQGVAPPDAQIGAEALDPEDWPVERFTPSAGQAFGSLALILAGLAATLAVDRLGGRDP
ncbi:MAG: DUF368 domain-containing protein, partial [Myxococcota bacterium]